MITYCPVSFLMYVHFDPQGDRVSWEQCLSLCILQCLARFGYPAGLSPVQSHVIVKEDQNTASSFRNQCEEIFFLSVRLSVP